MVRFDEMQSGHGPVDVCDDCVEVVKGVGASGGTRDVLIVFF